MISKASNISVKTTTGATVSVAIGDLLVAAASIMAQISAEWVGESQLDYIKYLAGLQASPYKAHA